MTWARYSLMAAILCVSCKCAFVLLHGDAMADELKGRVIGGKARLPRLMAGYFGGHVKPANVKAHRRDHRFAGNQNGKRKVVVIVRERGGNFRPRSFQFGKSSCFIHSRPYREGNGRACR
jgi:hypothetical protein